MQMRTQVLLVSALLGLVGCAEDEELIGLQQGSAIQSPGFFGGKQRITFQGESLPVVDMHLHTGRWQDIPAPMQAFLAEAMPPVVNWFPGTFADFVLSPAGILMQLNDANIGHGVLMALYATQSVGVAANSLVRERIAKYPKRLFGMASLPFEDWEENREAALQELAEYLALPEFIGVKLAHAHTGLAFNDDRFYAVYEVAGQFDAPVYLHTGNTKAVGARIDAPATDPAYLEDAIRRYPGVNFILGHMGYDFINAQLGDLETCIELALDYPNVYLETSALGVGASEPNGDDLRHILATVKENGLVERLIYGGDGPQRPGYVKGHLQQTLRAMGLAEYTVREARQFLFSNFAALYGLAEEDLL